ncbi:ATP-binding protein [Pseudaquidulcibacter saccharophilus]|uniref:ATP-binding protein n=1 Tax=Pseudaquidulcibacter saccharophilus TaxID=2831900 RepID=UPI001EFEF8FC|nr:ATP-binding protein [Pseudaquidulcibacter saccharophilus]
MNTQSTFNYDTSPNPAKLIDSLRYLGYDNYSAIADIIDNSLDAEASFVGVTIRNKGKLTEIIISDDGNGMSKDILSQAIRLGSDTTKDSQSDLGKFGMGLCTATLSICRRTTVLTKTETGKLLKAINDVDEVIKSNKFVSVFEEGDSSDEDLFHEMLCYEDGSYSSSGTIVYLQNCDNLTNSNITVFTNTLKRELSRIFRHYIIAGKEIWVNDDVLAPVDPLEWESNKTEKYCDETLEFEYQNDLGAKITESLKIKIAIIKPDYEKGENETARNMVNQGFYIMRNNREILPHTMLDLTAKHNSLNRMRGEISFSGNLDKVFGINFTKKNISINQALQDKLAQFLKGQLASISKKLSRETAKDVPDEINEIHENAAKEISKKSKLLIRPKANIEKRASPIFSDKQSQDITKNSSTREPKDNIQDGLTAKCEFKQSSMGVSGDIYEVDQKGRTIVITYNVDHPFYRKFISGIGENDRSLVAGIDYLVYSMATAELTQNLDDDGTLEIINHFKSIMASNLRTLLL